MRKAEIEAALAQRSGPGIRNWITSQQFVPCQNTTTNSTDRRREVARMVANKETARGWRVTLGPVTFVDGALTAEVGSPPIVAHVTWGFDSTRFDADIDWPAGGTHFNVWADTVVVELIVPNSYQTNPAFPASLPTTAVGAAAVISPAASSGGPRPTRTFFTGTIAAAANAVVAVPAMASGVRWHQLANAAIGNPPAALDFAGAQDAAFAQLTFTTPSGVYTTSEVTWPSEDGITLQPSTRFLRVTNRSAADISLQIEFVLDLE